MSFRRPVIGFRPDNVTAVRADQPRGDPKPRARFSHAPIQYVSDTQRFGDLGDGNLFALEIERGRGSRHPQARDLAEPVDQFLGHAVGELLVVHPFSQIEKREHGDGFRWLRSKLSSKAYCSRPCVDQENNDQREAKHYARGPRQAGSRIAWRGAGSTGSGRACQD